MIADQLVRPTTDMASRRGRWLRFAQIAWYVVAALTMVIFIASLPSYALRITGASTGSRVDAPLVYVALVNAASGLTSIFAAIVSLALALLLFRRKRHEPMALFVSFYVLGYGVIMAGPLEAISQFGQGEIMRLATLLQSTLMMPTAALLFLFPNGHFVPRWTRWLVVASFVCVPLTLMIPPTDWLTFSTPPAQGVGSLLAIILVTGLISQVYRYRRIATPAERQQTKWVGFGVLIGIVAALMVTVPYIIRLNLPPDAPRPWWAPLSELGWWLALTTFPVSLAISVMRYRLWDVDILINRTIVFGALTAIVIALYVVVVGTLSTLLQTSGNLLISLLATGLIAWLFQPLRARLQRGINRLMYGERDDPYAVLAQLGRRLETTLAPDAVLSTIVETIALALKLPYVAIEIERDDQAAIVAAYGHPTSQPIRLPLVFQSNPIGDLLVSTRGPAESFSPTDLNLLTTIAQQAGPVVHAVQLTADLQHSRERLVTAREEERRRIRRDLHDGLGPQLAALAMQADNAHELVRREPDRAEAILSGMTRQTQTALQDIRRLVYDLRPPSLDELGLIAALRAHVAIYQNTLHLMIEAPEPLPPLPAAVEVAAYRITQEALNNVVRHAQARNCLIRFALDDALQIEIQDDGRGLPIDAHSGVGLQSMRERAAELGGTCIIEAWPGGGTRIVARLPLSRG